MSAGRTPKDPVTSNVIGSIIITKTDNPSEGLKFVFNGKLLHKEILSATIHLPKEFRRYMVNQKQELDLKETSDES